MSQEYNLLVLAIYFLLLVMGVGVLFIEIVRNQCRNLIACVFFFALVVLLVAVPIAIHIAFGGAQTIVTEMGHVHDDVRVYLIYALCIFSVLASQLLISVSRVENHVRPTHARLGRQLPLGSTPGGKFRSDWILLMAYASVMGFAWYLYVRASGMGLFELMAASRFAWFAEQNHSLITGVFADYLIAVSPVFVFKALSGGRRSVFFFAIGIAILVGYGLCSKDRKWLIYIISGAIASYYLLSGRRILVTKRLIAFFIVLVLPLAFWQIFRDTLFGVALGIHTDAKAEATEMFVRVLRSGDGPYYYQSSIEAISQNLNHGEMVPLGLLRRQVFFFLPAKYSLGLKPEDISAIFSDIVHGGSDLRRGNMPPGFVGLFVLSFGWFVAPLLLAMVPLLIRALDSFVRSRANLVSDVILSMAFSSSLLWLRGDDSGGGYFVVSNLILAVILFQGARVVRMALGSADQEGMAIGFPDNRPPMHSRRDKPIEGPTPSR